MGERDVSSLAEKVLFNRGLFINVFSYLYWPDLVLSECVSKRFYEEIR